VAAIRRNPEFFAPPTLTEPQSLEGQAFAWQGQVGVEPLLPATIPLLKWLDEVRREAIAGAPV